MTSKIQSPSLFDNALRTQTGELEDPLTEDEPGFSDHFGTALSHPDYVYRLDFWDYYTPLSWAETIDAHQLYKWVDTIDAHQLCKWVDPIDALHEKLLREHHDFYLASLSLHPSASPELQRLTEQHFMSAQKPQRKRDVHFFLEPLRHRFPDITDHMPAYTYLAYRMMALGYKTMSEFEDTWIECLGNLGRYRMAINEGTDQAEWARVARSWYSKAQPDSTQQTNLYAQFLTLTRRCSGAFESITVVLNSILGGMKWWQYIKGELHRTAKRLERELDSKASLRKRVFKLASAFSKGHRGVIAAFLCAVKLPVVSAVSESDPVQTRAPIFRSDSAYDYVMYGIMLLYLGVAFLLRDKTTPYPHIFSTSFALMTGTGVLWVVVNRDEFADGIRKTVFEIWLTTALHVGAQYCYDNYNPKQQVMWFLALSAICGLGLLLFPSMSPLDALPPFAAVLALIAWAVHEHGKKSSSRQRQSDEEHGNASPIAEDGHALDDLTPPGHQSSGVHRARSDAVVSSAHRARPAAPSHNNLAHPDDFSIGDGTEDLASLRSDSPQVRRGT